MIKRKGLKLQLALAINEILGFQHALTIPNAKRYVTKEVRQRFRIRGSTKIELEDWIIAMQVVRVDRVGHFNRVSLDDTTLPEDRLVHIIDSIQTVHSDQKKPASPYV